MKKLTLTLLGILSCIILLVACQGTHIYSFVDESFNKEVIYDADNRLVDLTGLYFVDQNSEEKTPVTSDMVVSGGNTNTIGENQLVLSHNSITTTFKYNVYYKVEFVVNGSVFDTILVENAQEITLPTETPSISGFAGWEDIPSSINDNIQINAKIKLDIEPDTPSLTELNAVYGDTLANLTLPSNSIGHFEFIDDLTTTVGEVGVNEFKVKFIPNDPLTYKEVEDVVKVRVSQKEVTIEVSNKTFTYTGSEITLPYTLSVPGLDVVTQGITATDVNEDGYFYSIKVDDPNYYGETSGFWYINKAQVIVDVTPETVTYDKIGSLGTPEYKITSDLDKSIIDSLNIRVSYPTDIANAGEYDFVCEYDEAANTNVEVVFNNAKLTVTKASYEANDPEFDTLYYGDTLTNQNIHNVSGGHWELTNGDFYLNQAGNIVVNFTFYPTDSTNYESYTKDITITVNKKNVQISITKNIFTYDGMSHSLEYEIIGLVDGDDVPNVLGNESLTNVGSINNINLVIDDSNYSGELNGQRLVIEKADPILTKPELKATYLDTLSSVVLPKGYKWNNENQRINNVGTLTFIATYTPEDTNNYNILNNVELEIEVSKLTSTIETTSNEYLFILDGSSINISRPSTNNNETNIKTTYYLNGDSVEDFNQAGTYIVRYEVEETDHYLGATKEVMVYVVNLLNLDNVTYEEGLTLADIKLGSDELGEWSWVSVVSTLLNAGQNQQFRAKYQMANDLSKETTLSVNILQKELTFNSVVDTFTYDGEEHEVTYELEVSGIEVSRTNTTRTNAGSQEYTLTISDNNYYGRYRGTLTVNKAQVNVTINDIEVTYYPEYSFSYNDDSYQKDGIIYKDDELNISLYLDREYNGVGSYDILGSYHNENYEVIFNKGTLTVNVATPEVDVPTISNTIYYGDKLGDILLNQTSDLGEWSISDGKEIILNSANITNNNGLSKVINVLFTPNDITNYETIKAQITVTINKKTVTITGDNVTVPYDGQEHGINVSVPSAIDDEYTLSGHIAKHINVDTYTYTVSLASDYYVADNITVTLTIKKVDAKPSKTPENLSAVWNDSLTLNDISLSEYNDDNGTWSWKEASINLDVCETKSYNIVYTPIDEKNYNSVTVSVSVTVNKAEASVTADEEYIFMVDDDLILDNVKPSHSESEPTYNITNEPSKYTVTITLPESEHYKKATTQTSVIVLAKEGILENVNNILTYGDDISELTLPTSEYGEWHFEDTSPLGDVGHKARILVFKSNTSELTYKYEIQIEVQQKEVEIVVDEHEFIYDGASHTIKYHVTGMVGDDSEPEVSGNISITNVSESKEVTLTVNTLNYKGSKVVKLTIKPADITLTADSYDIKYSEDNPKGTYKVTSGKFYNADESLSNIEVTLEESDNYNVGTYDYVITATNNNYNFTFVKGTLTVNKNKWNENVEVTNDITYGDKLSDIKLTNSSNGKWELNVDSLDTVISVANGYVKLTITLEAKFTPNDETNYETEYKNVTFTVNKKQVTIETTSDLNINYDGIGHGITVSVSGAIDDEYTLSGHEETYINAGSHNYTVSLESDYYEAISKEITLTINKVDDPNYTIPSDLAGTWNEKLNTITLPDNWTWDNPEELIDGTTYSATYTPTNSNYNVKHETLTITVNRRTDARISLKEDSLTFIANSQDFITNVKNNVVIDKGEGQLVFVIKKDNEEVGTIIDVGTYEVTVYLSQSAHYDETSPLSFKVTVTEGNINEYEYIGIYGNTLDTVYIPTSSTGKWSWETPDVVLGKPGTYEDEYKLLFTPTSGSEVTQETTVTVTVNKRPVTISVTDKEVTYNKTTQSLDDYSINVLENDLNDETKYKVTIAGNTSGINVGKYTATYTLESKYYEASKVSKTLTINPKSVTITSTNTSMVYGNKVPESVLSIEGVIKGDDLNVQIANPTGVLNADSSYPYVITYDENSNYEVIVTPGKLTVRKATPEVDVPTISNTIYYGDTLGNIILNQTSDLGEWSISDDLGIVLNKDNITNNNGLSKVINVLFTPKDKINYETVTKQITITINKKTVTIVGENVTVPYDGDEHGINVSVPSAIDNEYTLSGHTAKYTNVGPYTYNVTLESDYYEASQITVYLTINKVDAKPSKTPENLSVVWNDSLTLNDISLSEYNDDNGTWSWEEASTNLDVCETKSYNAIYTPIDENNYNSVTVSVSVTVNKAEASVTADKEYIFMVDDDLILDNVKPSHSESTPEYSITNESGSYEVTITLPESEHYNEATTTTTVIVLAKEGILENANNILTYGDDITKLELPTSEYGAWYFEDTSDLGDVGTKTRIVVFKSNTSELTYKYEIQIEVQQKEVEIVVDEHEFIYDGASHTIKYHVTGMVGDDSEPEVSGNISITNVSESKEVTLTVNTLNYKGSKVVKLTIKPADITLTADSYDIKYSEDNPKGTYKVTSGKFYNADESLSNIEVTLEESDNYNVGTYDYVITATNNNYNFTFVKGTLTVNKNKWNENVEVTNDITYGDKLSDIKLTNSSNGKWELNVDSLDTVISVANGYVKLTITLEAKFTPNDETNYETEYKNVTFTVNKKQVTIETTSDLNINYDGIGHGITVSVSGAIDDEYTLSGHTAKYTNADTYEYNVSLESDYYEASPKEITLTINKADPEYQVPQGLTAVYGDSLSSISLPKGFSFTNLDDKINKAPSYETTLTYTPTDTDNYNVIPNISVTINVTPADNDLQVNEYYIKMYKSVFYISDYFTDKINKSSSGKLTYNIESINNHGVYNIIITQEETSEYKGITKEVTLIVIESISTVSVTYGDAFSDINLSSEYGILTVESNDLITMDSTEATVKFTYNKNQAYTTTFNISLNVDKRTIYLNIIKDKYTYDATPHNVTYEIDNLVAEDKVEILGNVEETDAGSYGYKLTLTDDRYVLHDTYSGTLIIYKADLDINLKFDGSPSGITINNDNLHDGETLHSEYYVMNDEHQLSIGYTYYIKGTETNVYPTVNVTLDRFDNRIDLSNYLDNYGTYTYKFNVDDSNFNSFSTKVNFDIYIARLTTNSADINYENITETTENTIYKSYTSLDNAISASQHAKESSYIFVYGNAVIGELDNRNNDLVLGANTELYLPHEDMDNASKYMNVDTAEVYLIENGVKTGTDFATSTNEKIRASYENYLNITIKQKLVVSGKITIGAARGSSNGANGTQGEVCSNYAMLTLNADLILDSAAKIYCFGYIVGSGTITANEGSYIYEPFAIYNWRGGNNASASYLVGKIVPFNEYKMHNIESTIIINKGANYYGIASIKTNSPDQWNSATYPLIGDGAIIELNSGHVKKYFDSNTNIVTLEIVGEGHDNSGQLTVASYDINTAGLYFGITHNLYIKVSSGSVFNITQYYKLLPGSSLIIDDGGIVNLSGKIIGYENWEDAGLNPSNGNNGSYKYSTVYQNAMILVNGTLNVSGGSLAGTITSENQGAVLNLADASELSITSKEGWGEKLIFFHETNTLTNTAKNIDQSNLSKTNYVYNGSMWVENSFTINFHIDGEVEKRVIYQPFDNTTYTVTGNELTPDKEFYEFVGWYLDANFNTKFTTKTLNSGESIDLYAKFEETIYTIDYSVGLAVDDETTTDITDKVDLPSTISFTISDLPLTLEQAAYNNYFFDGWYVGSNKDGVKIDTITEDLLRELLAQYGNNIPLYCEFKSSYTIVFDNNNDDVDIAIDNLESINSASDVNIDDYNDKYLTYDSNSEYSKYFVGWYLDKDGTIPFTSDIVLADYADNSTGIVTLYAKWLDKEYVVRYIAKIDGIERTDIFNQIQYYAAKNANIEIISDNINDYFETYNNVSNGIKYSFISGEWYDGNNTYYDGTSYTFTGASQTLTLYRNYNKYYLVTIDTSNATVTMKDTDGTSYSNGSYILVDKQFTISVDYGGDEDRSITITIDGNNQNYDSSTIYMATGPVNINASSSCLVEGTLITLADGTTKKVEDITSDDYLLVFNHESGKLDVAKVLFNDSESLAEYTIINLKFSNGSIVRVVSEHGFFDLDLNKYVYITATNYRSYIGHKFYGLDGDYAGIEFVLTDAYLTKETVRVYSPVAAYHLNYFTEGLLSMPGGIDGLFNIFEYDNNLQYDSELMEADITKYGLLDYSVFEGLVPYEVYLAFPAKYFNVAIGKGILTWDDIYYLINRYSIYWT